MNKSGLFSKLEIRNLALRNRVVVSPMQQYSAAEGLVNDWHLVHLGSRAVGGAGLIITECTAVLPEGRNTLFDAGLWNDEQADAWKPIIEFVKKQGAKIAVQLWHSGGKGSHTHPLDGMKYLPIEKGGWLTKSSSIVSLDGKQTSAELTQNEIEELIRDFVRVAERAVRCEFDAIELHAGHGYLFHQFYSALVNRRTDRYGGSFENRIRFLAETCREIRRTIPEEMPLLIRISAVDYQDDENGWTIEDSIKLAKILKEIGVDLITASGGGFGTVDKSKVYPLYQVPFASRIKSETGIMTGAVGLITTAEQADEIISQNHSDLVMIAREFLRNPYFPLHAAQTLQREMSIPVQYRRGFSKSVKR